MSFPGTDSGDPRRRLKLWKEPTWEKTVEELMPRWMITFRRRSGTSRSRFDAGGRHLHDSGTGTVARAGRAGQGEGERECRSGGSSDADDGGDGVEMFKKLLDEGTAGDNVGCCCGEWSGRTSSGAGDSEAGEHYAAHEVSGGGVCADEGKKTAAHAFFTATGRSFTFGRRT